MTAFATSARRRRSPPLLEAFPVSAGAVRRDPLRRRRRAAGRRDLDWEHRRDLRRRRHRRIAGAHRGEPARRRGAASRATKLGRRSYYRLTPDAGREFAAAARPDLRAGRAAAAPRLAPRRPAGRPDREAAARTLARLRFGLVSPHLAAAAGPRSSRCPRCRECLFSATTGRRPRARSSPTPGRSPRSPQRCAASSTGFAPLEGRRFRAGRGARAAAAARPRLPRDRAARPAAAAGAASPRLAGPAGPRPLRPPLPCALAGSGVRGRPRLHGPRRHARHRRGHPPPPAAAPRAVTLARRPAFG